MANTVSDLGLGDHSDVDMYQIAVHIEQGGYDFYSQIIERSENPQVKNEVISLRDDEAKHKAFFQERLKLRGIEALAELSGKLRSWLDQEFVKPMEKVLSSRELGKNKQALQLGVRLEQKTIDLYERIKAQSSDAGVLQDLQAIIDEEYKHKRKLNVLLAY
ncbi:MAG: ferritin family protein [Spirochaetaceae bacterium]|nr:MAG: ferritin family protein [Spirochaetaceae bacterium]